MLRFGVSIGHWELYMSVGFICCIFVGGGKNAVLVRV